MTKYLYAIAILLAGTYLFLEDFGSLFLKLPKTNINMLQRSQNLLEIRNNETYSNSTYEPG